MKRFLQAAALALATACGAAAEPPGRAEVLELLEVTDSRRQTDALVRMMAEQTLREDPRLAPARQTVTDFYLDCFGFDALEETIIGLYLEHYTPEELRQLTEFYRTPVGRKVVEHGVEFGSVGMRIGAERMRERLPEFQKNLEKALKK